MSKGAQISPTVNNLLVNYKIWDRPKMASWKPQPKKKTQAQAVPAQAPGQDAQPAPAEEKQESVGAAAQAETPAATQ